jgi:uncharacterized protein (TIRG00374 family)
MSQDAAWANHDGTLATLRRLQFLLGILISALALYAVLHDVRWSEVGERIRDANYGLLTLAVAVLLGTFVIKAMRWRLILQRPPGLRLWHLFGSLNVAYFINNLVPLQVGDFGRAYLVSELGGLSMTRTLSTVLVERVMDVLTLLAILLVLALFIDIPAEVRTPSLFLAVDFGTLTIVLVAVSRRPETALRLIERPLRLAPAASRPKLRQMAANGLDGVSVLTHPRASGPPILLSAVLWLGVGLVVYLGIEAFDLPVGYGAALFLVVATTFGFFVPSTPGSFGVYHAIVTAVLTSVFDVEKNAAVSFALVIHLVFYLPPMLLAPVFLWQERQLWRRSSFWDKLRELRGSASVEAAVE